MYIVHIINNLKIGGLQKFTLSLAEESLKKRAKIKIIVLENLKDKEIPKELDSIEIVNFKCSKHLDKLKNVYYYLNNEKPNIVHTHGLTLIYTTLNIFLNKRIKFVHTIHNLANIESGNIRRIFNKILFNKNNVIPVTISDEVEKSFKSFYKNTKSVKIYNGCKPPKLIENELVEEIFDDIGREKKIIINVGRIDYQKNQILLINAFNRLKEKYDISLIILGGPVGISNEFIKEIYDSNICIEDVYFLGEVTNVGNYLINSDIFCLSSRFEGLPISLLEAMSLGITCVSTPAGGAESVIKRGSGYVSDDHQIESLKNVLEKAICKPVPKNNITKIYNENYSMSICTDNYFRIYEN